MVLVGIKRIGINNFLRFFLNHEKIIPTYVEKDKNHLLIPIDLFDLVETEVYPFWVLTLKRILDAITKTNLPQKDKKYIERLFMDSIQSKELLLVVDSIRLTLDKIIQNSYLPTLFFIRFDRMKNSATPELYANIRGIGESLHNQTSFVFTSFRSLDELSPAVFKKSSVAAFAHNMYLPPAEKTDTKIIFEEDKKRYNLEISPDLEKALFELVDGYVRYLELALIILSEKGSKISSPDELFEILTQDEGIILQSEELWETLNKDEQEVLVRILNAEKLSEEEKDKAKYLWEAGFVFEDRNQTKIFSPLFENFLKSHQNTQTNGIVDFTHKENLLFEFLKTNIGQVCERDSIIESVWPEEEDLGVTDWAVDRLVSRVRNKLKKQKSHFEIQTIKTRGYKLTNS
ncbi:MAG: hypothetical protein UT01_C0025G0017 [Candidatus Daviesbacteria bacterium GW2011_GWA1_38_7]|nr:MAG: hypothetical protein UT01_C0025G0017 [Candidatus Daviesbacteria bacterium GW2011_GWA1_38_7]